MNPSVPSIELIEVASLRHIEGFSARRVEWLERKILAEGIWRVPLVLDRRHHLVMDGQHRMEVARRLRLAVVPALLYRYDEVEVWSLRPARYTVSAEEIIARALAGEPYPYKTAKHRFPCGALPALSLPLAQLRRGGGAHRPDAHSRRSAGGVAQRRRGNALHPRGLRAA